MFDRDEKNIEEINSSPVGVGGASCVRGGIGVETKTIK